MKSHVFYTGKARAIGRSSARSVSVPAGCSSRMFTCRRGSTHQRAAKLWMNWSPAHEGLFLWHRRSLTSSAHWEQCRGIQIAVEIMPYFTQRNNYSFVAWLNFAPIS